MKTKLRYFLVLLGLLTFALVGCDLNEPDQKLTVGFISFEQTNSTIHWQKVDDAVGYNLSITGEGTSKEISELIDETYYNEDSDRYEYIFESGVEGKQFTVKLIAIGDGKNYASSSPTTARFTFDSTINEPIQLILGEIGYDNTQNLIYWSKIDNAASYELSLSGVGVSEESSTLIDTSYYNQTVGRYEFLVETGINGKQITASLIAYGDGTNYLNSEPKTSKFTCVNTQPVKPKLVMSNIGFDIDSNILYWNEVAHAVNYQLKIEGAGVSAEVDIVVTSSNYNTIKQRYEYEITNGVDGLVFTVKLIAVADEINYTSSNQVTKSFNFGKEADYDYSSNPYYANLGLESVANSEVKAILNQKLRSYTQVSYGDARYAIVKSDIAVNNPTKTYGIYNGLLFDNVWDGNKINREHVWPCARLGTGRPDNNTKAISSDLHNLRVIQPSINSTRSDKYFVQGPKSTAEKVGADAFYPGDEHAGDVARICFYMATMYLNLTLVNEANLPNAAAYTQANAFMGDLASMLRWHIEDPVDEFEIYRNEVLFGYQKNRNPYVDFPDLVQRVFGASSSQLSTRFNYDTNFANQSVTLIKAVYVNVSKNEYLCA